MAANDPYIKISVKLENSLYKKFHKITEERGQTHNGAIIILIKRMLKEAEEYWAIKK
jgi:hypothetical protein